MSLTMTADDERPMGLFERLQACWHNLQERRAYLAELERLDGKTLEKLAHESGVSTFELLQIASAGANAADEMPVMMQALNIDPSTVQANDAYAFRNMQANCATCTNKKGCRADLHAGTAAENYLHYCNNAETLNMLRAEPEMLIS